MGDANVEDLVSVIVPVYNVELFVERCIRSILEQKYKKIELIVVDDGTTDNSIRICEELAKQDTRICIIHKVNGGLSSARNCGLEKAKGKYVVFVDSDDFIQEEYISLMHEIAVESGANLVICGYEKGRKGNFTNLELDRAYKVYSSEEMLYSWHSMLCPKETVSWNKLYLREQLIKMEFKYPEGVYYEDVRTSHLIVDKAGKIAVTNSKLYYYYQRADSISKSLKSEKNIWDNISAQNIRLHFFEEREYTGAVERLKIGREKFYMLMYFLTENRKTKKELKKLFRDSYWDICNSQEVSIVEKGMFILFRWIFARTL